MAILGQESWKENLKEKLPDLSFPDSYPKTSILSFVFYIIKQINVTQTR